MLEQSIPQWLSGEVRIQRGLPVYLQLKEELRSAILSRRLEPGTSLPEERELATLMKVSRGTMRRALQELADEKLIVRHHGRRTVVADTNQLPAVPLAVIFEHGVSTEPSGYLGQVVRELVRSAGAHGAEVLLRDSHTRRVALTPAAQLFILPNDLELLRELSRKGQVVLSIDLIVDGAQVDSIVYDNAGCFAELTRRLIGMGHRRIAYIDVYNEREGVPLPNANSPLRKAGYCAAMDEAGLPHFVTLQSLNPDAIATELPKFLAEVRPTALAAFDDTAAFGAHCAAQSMGLSVPQDLSIATVRLKEQTPRGGLDVSGCVVSQADLARLAVERAIARVEKKDLAGGEILSAPWTWHDGATMAPPKR
jgi:DNA-binding LacI/PurR family transcriptional regulator